MNWQLYPAGAFAAHADAWQRLNQAGVRSPLLHPDFVQALVAQFATPQDWLAVCRDGGQPVAMALLRRDSWARWSSFQPSQQPVSLWLNLPGRDLPALLRSLLRALPGLPLVLNLVQRDPHLSPRPAEDATLASSDYIQTARIVLDGSFDAYWEQRGKNLRSNLRKQRNRLEREGIAARLEIVREPQQVAQAVADYGRLESAGWKADGGTAVHADNAQGRFYTSMLEGFCRRGQGRVLRYWLGERLAAVNLCVEGDGALIILKTTYDEQLDGNYSPAFLILEETLQELFAQGAIRRLEFYGKVMAWHQRWSDDVRTMYHLTQYRWAWLRRLHAWRRQRAAPAAAPQAGLAAGAAD